MKKRGRYRHRVDIERRLDTQAAGGQRSLTFVSVERGVPASIRPLKASEIYTAAQYSPSINHAIEMDYRAGLTTEMRIVFESQNYDIKGILDEEMRHVNLTLYCETGVSVNG